MKVEVNNPCFICGSSESESVFDKAFPEHDYPGRFYIRKCSGCDLLFNSPRLEDSKFPSLYAGNYYFFKRTDENEFFRIVEVYRRTVSLVNSEVFPKKVLEVGSSKGYLLAVMKQLGWKVQGVEISKEAASYAIGKFNVPTFIGAIEGFVNTEKAEKYPLVLAIDVLEHILYPEIFIRTIYETMEDNGLLIIDTPNSRSGNLGIEKPFWKGFNPFHIFVFSKTNLSILMKKNHYTIEKVFSYGNDIWRDSPERNQKFSVKLRHQVKSLLKKLSLLETVEREYQKSKQWLNTKWYKRDYLLRAVSMIQNNLSYFETGDSVGPLAKDCRGDNMVLIARKKNNQKIQNND